MLTYRKEIDGLRAFAVMPVLFFHAGYSLFSGGYVGVDVFFVISGFLIGSIILKELSAGQFTLINFYERRARRILPALYFVMACCIPFAVIWMLPDDLQDFFSSLIATSVFASNILFYLQSGYFESAAELKPLLHTWSLAVEEQFYIVFPLMMIVLWRIGVKKILLIIFICFLFSLMLSEWASYNNQQANFYLPITRAWELLVGVLCAFYIHRNGLPKRSWKTELASIVGFLGLVAAVILFDKGARFPGFYALIPVLGTALILLYGCSNTYVGKLLSLPVFVGIGLVSYSAYLWHHPLFAFARIYSVNEPTALLYGVLIIFSLLLAFLSWRYVEQPFRKKDRFSRWQIFSFSIGGGLFFIIIGLAGYFTPLFERNMSALQKAIYSEKGNIQSFHTVDGRKCSDQNQCSIGVQGKEPSILLIGDSHAGHLIHHLDRVLIEKNKAGRTMSDTDIYLNHFPDFYPKNNEFNDALVVRKEAIFSDNIETVILSGRYTLRILRSEFDNQEGGVEKLKTASDYHGYSVAQQAEVKKQIRKGIVDILNAGKKVILVYPIPEVGWDVPSVHLKLYEIMNHDQFKENIQSLVTTDYAVYKERNKQTIKLFDSIQHKNLYRVYPNHIFCDTYLKNRCVTASQDRLYYVDDDHLSLTGSELIVQRIERFL